MLWPHKCSISENPHTDWESERRRAREALWLQLASLFSCLPGVLLSPLSSYNCFSTHQPPHIFSVSSVYQRDVLVSRWTEMTVPLWSPDSLQLLKAHRRALFQLCNNWAVLFLVFLISAYLLGLFKISRLSGDGCYGRGQILWAGTERILNLWTSLVTSYKVTPFHHSDRLAK